MKKFLKFICVVIAMVLCFIGFSGSEISVASAAVSEVTVSSDIDAALGFAAFTERAPGSDGEKNAANYIKNYLSGTTLTPKSNNYIADGVQEFNFKSAFDGAYKQSQNIIFDYKVSNSNKWVIIGCHYDAIAYKVNEAFGNLDTNKFVASQSIAGSAGSVATLLAIAKNLSTYNLKFNVEIVFFGAGESNNAGSEFYVQGISAEERENILCMINLDSVAVGKNLYFYMDEIKTNASNFVSKTLSDATLGVREVELVHLNKVLTDGDELGLGYYHIAMISDNYSFKKKGISTISFFAGDYSDGIVIGRSEFAGQKTICYTENDNLTYIKEKYGNNAVKDNLILTYNSIIQVLSDSNFASTFDGAAKSMSAFNAFFTNKKLVYLLTACGFIVLIIVSMIIHYKLSVKSYYANVEVEFLSSVVKITENIGEPEANEQVAKAVSQVVAMDIKKDKMIKPEKKKKGEK
ncbi:MAG: M28 family peptidase [Clostridia bacterium]|nr:M28 family peptidase [Clostridia bacterium]